MDFKTTNESPEQLVAACVVVTLDETKTLSSAAQTIDKASNGYLTELIEQGDIAGKNGQILLLHKVPGVIASRVLLVGTGKVDDLDDRKFTTMINKMLAELSSKNISDATCYLTELPVKERDATWLAKQWAQLAENSLYKFEELKSEKGPAPTLKSLSLGLTAQDQESKIIEACKIGQAISNGMTTARTLGNLPGNFCTPTYLADQAEALAQQYPSLETSIVDEAEMKELGMGALLSVSAGSEEPAKLIIMNYQGGKTGDKPHVLVGKGITFDTGGISLKPGEAMDEMKFDMCGAASVLGTMTTILELGLPLNIIGVITSAENMPSGIATKPGDIVTTMSGQTVEILNTDAEGRLVLCDALTYVEKFEPASVIDIATLTGACIMALGHHTNGLLSNNDELANRVLTAGKEANDKTWQLPLWDEYQEQLDSNFADIANIGGRPAGTITAGCFLSRFTKKYAWAHLDIAGTAWKSGKEKGASGRPVPLLTQYLLNQVG